MLRRLHVPVLLSTFFALAVTDPSAAWASHFPSVLIFAEVINAATVSPSRALVQVPSGNLLSRNPTDHYVFTNLPRGQVSLAARKPGT